ncbi:MAG: aminotransferase class V-fold PLP-dependent enzyme [Deltaproteobacteria bacterium]|nr:aminotransferase class V-fold PLP-dependent enzyme [Deltaproteobacteria bacterium]
MTILSDPILSWARAGTIGAETVLQTGGGARKKRYFDQTASGQAFGPIEDVIRNEVLPLLCNTHTEANTGSRHITSWYEQAHEKVRKSFHATADDVVVFVGSGATGAINRLIGALGIRIPDPILESYRCREHLVPEQRPLVVCSRMEHHSNDLPWRESIAQMEAIGYDTLGRPDWRELDRLLTDPRHRDRPLKIGTFSAASNVTGILSDVDALARVMHAHGGFAFFDYAAAAPYVDVDLHPRDDPALCKDAVFVSMHKFLGGPQAPGLLVADRSLFRGRVPVEPGGGTVLYTSPWEHRYLADLQHRESGGTPPIVQVIRAGLVLDLKERIGVDRIQALEAACLRRAVEAWAGDPKIRLLGDLEAPRIGILSFILDDGLLHHNLAVRLLDDLYGIQVRGGCMCAGTYGHDLLGIGRERSEAILARLDAGEALARPGWVRASFSPATSREDLEVLLEAVPYVAHHWREHADRYVPDPLTADWYARDGDPPVPPLELPGP